MDKISDILAKKQPTEEDMIYLRRLLNYAIDCNHMDYSCELKSMLMFLPTVEEVCKAFAILLDGKYESRDDLTILLTHSLKFVQRLKVINLNIPIDNHILDQLVPIIFYQDLSPLISMHTCRPLTNLFIWMKAFLALQILMRGLRMSFF